MRPRILIPTPTSFDEAYNQQCWPEYAAAITAAGGDPVQVPLTHSVQQVQAAVECAQGILLPGSPADVDPARYGHSRNPATADADTPREQMDFALLKEAELRRVPLLGICMGLQSLNSRYGGSLIQDLDPLPVNHRAGRAVQAAHTVLLSPESRLYSIAAATAELVAEDDGSGLIPVNSSHHQAIDMPGDTLRVTARCRQDGVIEAVEGSDQDHWLVAVQWHPERTSETSPTSAALFRTFVDACRRPPA